MAESVDGLMAGLGEVAGKYIPVRTLYEYVAAAISTSHTGR